MATTKSESLVEYEAIVRELEQQGYVIFGCSQNDSGRYEFEASGPNGAGMRRVSVRRLPNGSLRIW